MKVLIVLAAVIVVATAFDCFGRNNSCVGSHIMCDTGYDPYCDHAPGREGRFIGICTCDKDCKSAADCTNDAADGCPDKLHAICDTVKNVCHCFWTPPETNDSN